MHKIKITYPDGTDAEMRFTEHLTAAILNGQLAPGLASTGDWLQLLAIEQVAALANLVEGAFLAPEQVHPDVFNLVLQLLFLETGALQQTGAIDEVIEDMNCLLVICQLETCRRQGYVAISGQWRLTGPDWFQASLTEQGSRAADQPGAPACLRILKQQTGSPHWN